MNALSRGGFLNAVRDNARHFLSGKEMTIAELLEDKAPARVGDTR